MGRKKKLLPKATCCLSFSLALTNFACFPLKQFKSEYSSRSRIFIHVARSSSTLSISNPAQYQNRYVHEIALSAPWKSFYHFPWDCIVLVHQRHIQSCQPICCSSHQFFQCILAVNNGLGQLSAKVAWRVRERHAFLSSMRTLTLAIGVWKGFQLSISRPSGEETRRHAKPF